MIKNFQNSHLPNGKLAFGITGCMAVLSAAICRL